MLAIHHPALRCSSWCVYHVWSSSSSCDSNSEVPLHQIRTHWVYIISKSHVRSSQNSNIHTQIVSHFILFHKNRTDILCQSMAKGGLNINTSMNILWMLRVVASTQWWMQIWELKRLISKNHAANSCLGTHGANIIHVVCLIAIPKRACENVMSSVICDRRHVQNVRWFAWTNLTSSCKHCSAGAAPFRKMIT